jgi:hypothetical protein
MSGAEYIREWRKTEAGKASLQAQKRRAAARRRAMQRLVSLHPAEFESILKHELEQEERRGGQTSH